MHEFVARQILQVAQRTSNGTAIDPTRSPYNGGGFEFGAFIHIQLAQPRLQSLSQPRREQSLATSLATTCIILCMRAWRPYAVYIYLPWSGLYLLVSWTGACGCFRPSGIDVCSQPTIHRIHNPSLAAHPRMFLSPSYGLVTMLFGLTAAVRC